MPWSDFIGNAAAVEHVRALVAAGQAERTLVISGPTGLGKTTMAWMLGLALNCTDPPGPGDFCGICPSCRAAEPVDRLPELIEQALEYREREVRGNVREAAPLTIALHPAIRIYPPDGEMIGINQARAVAHQAQLTPDDAYTWCLILPRLDEARWMVQASLLKTLEEPPPRVCLVVLARNPLDLIPTVRSRAMMISLHPLPAAELEAALPSRLAPGEADDELALRAHLAQGRPGTALRLHLDEYRELRRQAFTLVRAAAGAGDAQALFRVSESTRSGKEKFESLIEILYSVLQDILYLQTGYSEAVRNRDCLAELAPMAATFCADQIPRAIEGVDRIQSAARRNANRALALDAWALELAEPRRRR